MQCSVSCKYHVYCGSPDLVLLQCHCLRGGTGCHACTKSSEQAVQKQAVQSLTHGLQVHCRPRSVQSVVRSSLTALMSGTKSGLSALKWGSTSPRDTWVSRRLINVKSASTHGTRHLAAERDRSAVPTPNVTVLHFMQASKSCTGSVSRCGCDSVLCSVSVRLIWVWQHCLYHMDNTTLQR